MSNEPPIAAPLDVVHEMSMRMIFAIRLRVDILKGAASLWEPRPLPKDFR